MAKQLELVTVKHLKRVADRIGWFVRAFIDQKRAHGLMFTMIELTEFVIGEVPHAAPDSPGRILRLLRKQGKLNYVCVSRKDSRYAAVPLPR